MEEKEKKLQEKYVELKILDQQIKQAQKQIQLLENQIMELSVVKQSLLDLEKVKEGTEILTPLGSGIFAKASLRNIKDLLVNVGANVVVKKDINSAKVLVDEQIIEMKKAHMQMNSETQEFIQKAVALQEELSGYIEDE